jgi:hypothetical protein
VAGGQGVSGVTEAALDPGIRIEVIWCDEDLLEFRFQASNGRFEATVEFYEAHSASSDLAAAIEGFPRSTDDLREVVLGTRGSSFAGGGVRMRFRCVDLVGHAEVHLEVHQATGLGHEPGTAVFSVRVEPCAVDDFVADLHRIRLEEGSHARLRGNP